MTKLNSCTKLIKTDLSKRILNSRDIISLSRSHCKGLIWDVTNGFHEAYEKIVDEIKNENPDIIVLPVGSGESFVGIYEGIKKSKLKTKLVGVSVNNGANFADKLHTPWTPYESKINSILKKGNEIIKLEEKEVKEIYKKYKDKFDVEPSSSVVFGIFPKLKIKKGKKVVLINSGKGLF